LSNKHVTSTALFAFYPTRNYTNIFFFQINDTHLFTDDPTGFITYSPRRNLQINRYVGDNSLTTPTYVYGIIRGTGRSRRNKDREQLTL